MIAVTIKLENNYNNDLSINHIFDSNITDNKVIYTASPDSKDFLAGNSDFIEWIYEFNYYIRSLLIKNLISVE